MPTRGKDASMAQRGWKMQLRDQQPRLLGVVTSELAKGDTFKELKERELEMWLWIAALPSTRGLCSWTSKWMGEWQNMELENTLGVYSTKHDGLQTTKSASYSIVNKMSLRYFEQGSHPGDLHLAGFIL